MNPTAFNPTFEYDSLPDATYTGLGSHICDCITTGVNEADVSYVMYPNPVVKGGVVTINTNSKIKTIKVTNIVGAKVMSLNKNYFSTADLSKGTYIISIQLLDGRFTENRLFVE